MGQVKSQRAVPEVLAALLAALGFVPGLAASPPAKVRKFDFYYQVTVKDPSAEGAAVRLWIPVPPTDAHQTVALEGVTGPVRLRETAVPGHGNRMMYAEWRHLKSPQATFTLRYRVTRREYSRGDYARLLKYNRADDPLPPPVARYLRPDRLVPAGGKLAALAEANTRGRPGAVEKAYALYNYVFHHMRYDKSGSGWGRGDALWACDARHGNCTDFHSLFIALARDVGIPARFNIGFPLPEGARSGTVPGYHCWVEFYVDGAGWVPADISEAWLNPARHDYYFGSVDANRVRFSRGRDLTLAPRQAGPPLNYFVYPYAEVHGKPYENITDKFWFKDQP
jgi:transglutaminase-like putative cysteine protease